jgi:hypothetical protein
MGRASRIRHRDRDDAQRGPVTRSTSDATGRGRSMPMFRARRVLPRSWEPFLYTLKGAPAARQTVQPPSRIEARAAKSSGPNVTEAKKCHQAGRGCGVSPRWGGGLPCPTGRSPPGAPPPVGCPIPADRWRTLSRCPDDRACKANRGVLRAGRPLAEQDHGQGRTRGCVPSGRPLTVIFRGKTLAPIGRARSLEVPAVGDERPFGLTPRPGWRSRQ